MRQLSAEVEDAEPDFFELSGVETRGGTQQVICPVLTRAPRRGFDKAIVSHDIHVIADDELRSSTVGPKHRDGVHDSIIVRRLKASVLNGGLRALSGV